MNLTRLRSLPALLTLLAAFALTACGGDDPASDGGDRFEVAFASPAETDTLFVGEDITFALDVVGLADSFDPTALTVEWEFGDGSSASGSNPSREHAYEAPGQYVVTATAEEGGFTQSASLSVTVSDRPDLRLLRPTLSSPTATITSDDQFRVTVDLLGQLANTPVPFSVNAYLVPAATFGAEPPAEVSEEDLAAIEGLLLLAEERFEDGLASGDQANIDWGTLQIDETIDSGDYYVIVVADADQEVPEFDENNNAGVAASGITFVNTSGDGPDIVVREVVVRPTRVNELRSVTIDASIANVGNQPALLFDYAVYLSAGDSALDEADTLLTTVEVANLTPDVDLLVDDLVVPVDPAVSELGEYFIVIEADSGDAVEEASEENNTAASSRILITDEPVPGVDIIIDAFEILPRTTFLEGTVELSATVTNQGTDDISRQFFCRVYLSPDDTLEAVAGGDRALTAIQVNPIPAGESVELVEVARIQSFFEEGDYYTFMFCDPSFAVPEADEDNNIVRADGTMNIASEAVIDLSIGEFSVAPSEVENDGTVEVSVEVCNEGSNGSTPSVVRVHISEDPLYDTTDTVLLQSNVPPIEPGTCLEIRATVPAVCDTFVNEYNVWAIADANNDVPEQNEDNNNTLLGDSLIIDGLICDCENDRFEPNDTLGRAAFINPGVSSYEDLSMCDANVDWYRIPLLRGETIRVVATFDNDRGNLDMTLFGVDRSTQLDSSTTDGDREEVAYFVAPQSGDYYLKVEGRTEDDVNVYDLELSLSSRDSGTDLLVLETSIDPIDPVLGEVVELSFDVVNLGDTESGSFLTRFYLSDDADIDPADDVRLGELEIDEVVDRVSRTVDVALPDDVSGGERYVGVIADVRGDIDELNEDNNIGVSDVFRLDDACFDAFEPNNLLDEPRFLDLATDPPVIFGDLLACSENRDFYEVCVDNGSFLSMTVDFNNTDGDIDLRLFDETGTEVGRSEGVGSQEQVQLDYVTGDRCYRLEVFVVGRDREVPYQLTVDTGDAPDELACSLIEEPSDDFAAALQLREFLDEDMAICPVDDQDYFRVSLTAGTELSLQLLPAEGETAVPDQLRIALFSPSRGFITSSVSATEVLRPTISLSGTHYIRVRSNGDGPRNQQYRLGIEGISGADLVPTDFVVEPEAVSPGDTVRFTFTLSNTRDEDTGASSYAIYISDDPVLDEGDTLVREVPLDPVAGLDSRLEGRRFDIPDDIIDGGTYYAILFVDNQEEVAEFVERNNVLVAPLEIAPRCLADVAEPNNFSFEAYAYDDLVEGEPLSLCPEDVDWFTFSPRISGDVTATIRFSHAEGDLDLYVYDDPAGEPIALSDSVFDDESVTFRALSSQTYYFRVDSFYSDTNSYTFDIDAP